MKFGMFLQENESNRSSISELIYSEKCADLNP